MKGASRSAVGPVERVFTVDTARLCCCLSRIITDITFFIAYRYPYRLICSLEEHVIDDNAKLSASEIHSYLTRVMYNKVRQSIIR